MDNEEFKQESDKRRLVKFKVAKCPKVIYDQFKEFALNEAGDLYPSALAILLERSRSFNNSLHIYNDIEEIKQYIAYLQQQVHELQSAPIKEEKVDRAFKSFGQVPNEKPKDFERNLND